MDKMTNIPRVEGKKRIVIIGGGFGGLKLATKLNPDYFQVVLLDKNNFHQFQPLLYQVAISGLEVSSIAYPFRKNFQNKNHIHFRMCEVTKITPEKCTVETSGGSVRYDYLVVAAGCDTNFFGNDALQDTTLTLKSASEALFVRNQMLQNFEQAAISRDEDEIKKLMTFVIVGGGATGVELAGALADMKRFILHKDYPELDLTNMQIHLIDASPRLLAAMSEKSSAHVAKTLTDRGVIIHHDVFVTSYEDQVVKASDGSVISTANVLWVAGIKANHIDGLEDSVYTRGGRFIIDEYCKLKAFDNIYAIGDIAYMQTADYPNAHPQVAQVAIQMATYIAKSLEQEIKGKKTDTFQYNDKGSLATIGRSAAVAELSKLKFGGRVAWWLWLLIHVLTIVGVKNKVLVMLDWAWSYVTYDVSLRLLIRPVKKGEKQN